MKVLLIDDEPDLLELCVDTFEMGGHSVVACASAKEAIAVLEKELDFDVIVSDESMPNMTGHRLFIELKQNYGDRLAPFFLATGAIDLDEDNLRAIGVNGIICKPYDVDDMIVEIEEAVAKLVS